MITIHLLQPQIQPQSQQPPSSIIYEDTNDTRQCRQPIVKGRLSGPSIAMIHWEEQYQWQKANNDVVYKLTGRYHVQSSGRYFIDIIGIMCNGFDFDTDFTSLCLDDPLYHRLTSNGAFIDISISSPLSLSPSSSSSTTSANQAVGKLLGYWQWDNGKKKQSQTNSYDNDYIPLYTRFQPQGCRGDPDAIPHCKQAVDTSRFDIYHFQFNDSIMKEMEHAFTKNYHNLSHVDSNNNTNINNMMEEKKNVVCAIGFSHSKYLSQYMTSVRNKYNLNDNIGIEWVRAKFPNDIIENFIKDEIGGLNCTKVVVALGQWPAAWHGEKPTLLPEYEIQMKEVMTIMKDFQKDLGFDLYFRSIHYNPIGDWIGACPPKDWRSPPVVDGYNYVLEKLCNDFGLPFIDTNFIISPMWDTPSDWNHFGNEAGKVEAIYIMDIIFKKDPRYPSDY